MRERYKKVDLQNTYSRIAPFRKNLQVIYLSIGNTNDDKKHIICLNPQKQIDIFEIQMLPTLYLLCPAFAIADRTMCSKINFGFIYYASNCNLKSGLCEKNGLSFWRK